MALVRRRDGRTVGDLLVAVVDIGVEPVVIDSDVVVGIAGGESDLEVGGEEVGDGGIEGIEGDVFVLWVHPICLLLAKFQLRSCAPPAGSRKYCKVPPAACGYHQQ